LKTLEVDGGLPFPIGTMVGSGTQQPGDPPPEVESARAVDKFGARHPPPSNMEP
jgi:hypothetical protein